MKIGSREPFTTDCNKTSTGFTYDDKLSFDENMLHYRSYLSDFEKNNFDSTRQSKYWWTFGTCILYGSLALLLLLFGSLTTYGNYLLFNELYIFIITYIIGTILIIIILIYKVYSFDFPDTNKKVGSDSLYCPDYWDSSIINPISTGKHNKKVGKEYTRYFGKKNSNSDFNLECSLKEDSGIYNSNSLIRNSHLNQEYGYKQSISDNSKIYVELQSGNSGKTGLSLNNGDYEEFRKIAASMAGYTYDITTSGEPGTLTRNNDNAIKNSQGQYFDAGNSNTIPLVCDKVYPLYMAKKDFEYSNSKGLTNYNKFRCAYSKTCGIPWTEVGCS